MPTEPDRRLAAIARRQHGAFSRTQALAAGMTERMVERRLKHGGWTHLDRGVYSLFDAPGTWHRQLMAATLTAQGAVISGRSAAALHGIDGFRPGPIEITVPRSGRMSRTWLATTRSGDVGRANIVNGIPCTSIPRTLRDLAVMLDRTSLRQAVESSVVQRLADLDNIQELTDRPDSARCRGNGALRRVLAELGSDRRLPTSQLEIQLRRALDHPTLPPFEFEVEMPWWPSGQGRVDALCRPARLIVEADGREWHTRYEAFRHDRQRDNLAVANGHVAIRFTHADLRPPFTEARALLTTTIAARSHLDPPPR